jgi:hypothetical protein
MNIYNAVVDIEVRSDLYDEKYFQILRELQSEISGKVDTNIRLVVNRSNVDLAIQKIKELREGHYITEVKKQELINRLLLFKNR